MLSEELLNESRKIQDTIVSYRRYLHSHPGTGFEIKDTLSFVKEKLMEMGYAPEKCGKAGLVACAGGKKEGKVFLLRADMDGLPIAEESGLDFAAQNGKMHACGHDLHTAMLLGAARLLKQHEDAIEGTVKLMFQPAEEIFEGSQDMIQSGLLENPSVDKALMIHVMSAMPFPAGTVIVSAPGVSAPGADIFEIKVQGKGVHGSMPNLGIDPLNAAAHILIALQEIQARELALEERSVLTIGTMNAGSAPNVIPDSVIMSGSIRTFDEETRAFVKNRLIDIATGTAQTFRAKAEVTFKSGCPTLLNDEELSASMLNYARELLGSEYAYSVKELNAMAKDRKASGSAGSEDFAYVSQKVPSIMLALAAGHPEQGYVYPQHHPMVAFDEAAMTNGCAIYAYAAIRWLEEHKATPPAASNEAGIL